MKALIFLVCSALGSMAFASSETLDCRGLWASSSGVSEVTARAVFNRLGPDTNVELAIVHGTGSKTSGVFKNPSKGSFRGALVFEGSSFKAEGKLIPIFSSVDFRTAGFKLEFVNVTAILTCEEKK